MRVIAFQVIMGIVTLVVVAQLALAAFASPRSKRNCEPPPAWYQGCHSECRCVPCTVS